MSYWKHAVAVVMMLSLCAVAWADHDIADPYYAPEAAVTVDGDLSEWAGDTWIPLDEGTAPDVTSARYAVRWSEADNVIYVAAEVVDTDHQFGAADGAWNARDIIEISIDAGNHDVYFLSEMGYGQQIIVDGAGTWIDAAWENPVGTDLVPVWSSGPIGDTLTYEVAIVPYAFYAGWGATDEDELMGSDETVEVDLGDGTTIGLDLVAGCKGVDSFGQLANNTVGGKFQQGASLQTWIMQGAGGQPGDADGDGDVDLDDFSVLKNNFGRTGVTAGAAEGDFDGDGDVDLDDFTILKNNFGTTA
ncbi:MAG: dockerin type I domain-containing protein [Planctomycetota bacterium]